MTLNHYFCNMKYFLLFACTASFSAFTQIITFSEDFNMGIPASWQLYDEDGLTPDPGVSNVSSAWVNAEDTDSTGISDSCAVSTSWYSPAGTSDDWLVSPLITVGGNNNFLFWDIKSEDPSFAESYEIYISSAGSTPTILKDTLQSDLVFNDTSTAPFWTRQSINIDAYAGQQIYIAFRNISTDKFLLFLDNVLVTENDPLTVQEYSNNIQLYPNPTSETLFIEGLETDVPLLIYNAYGQLVLSANSNNNGIDVRSLTPGHYVIHAYNNNNSFSKTFIVH